MIVRKLRLKRGRSQSQLAEMAGVTTRTIQRIEQGRRPSMETCKALASVFEVDLSLLQPQDGRGDWLRGNWGASFSKSKQTGITPTKWEASYRSWLFYWRWYGLNLICVLVGHPLLCLHAGEGLSPKAWGELVYGAAFGVDQ